MCSAPLDPGREVHGCSEGCAIGMSDILFSHAAAKYVSWEYPELSKLHFSFGCVLGAAGFRAFIMSEHDRRHMSHYFNPPLVRVTCGLT